MNAEEMKGLVAQLSPARRRRWEEICARGCLNYPGRSEAEQIADERRWLQVQLCYQQKAASAAPWGAPSIDVVAAQYGFGLKWGAAQALVLIGRRVHGTLTEFDGVVVAADYKMGWREGHRGACAGFSLEELEGWFKGQRDLLRFVAAQERFEADRRSGQGVLL